MNNVIFKAFDLINRNALDNSCWGVDEDFNLNAYDSTHVSYEMEGKYLWIWVDYAISDFSGDEFIFLLDHCSHGFTVNSDNGELEGHYLFFNLD